jgi:hypothetical protein
MSQKGSAQTNEATGYYNQMGQEGNDLFQSWQGTFLPEIQKLFPELQGALDGSNSTLRTAAMAPVQAETASNINNVRGTFGSGGNPNALVDDIALQGQTAAGEAGASTVNTAVSGLEGLSSLGGSIAGEGTSAVGGAAGGLANVGNEIDQSTNQFWGQILGAAGTAAGYGAFGSAASGLLGGGGSSPASSITQGSNFAQTGGYSAEAGGWGAET